MKKTTRMLLRFAPWAALLCGILPGGCEADLLRFVSPLLL